MRVVAVDGPAGSGKSTVSRRLAAHLGFDHLDTGAMYRAVAWLALEAGADPADEDAVMDALANRLIEVGPTVTVGATDVTAAIRGPEVSAAVSIVAAHPRVRAELRRRQRSWARGRPGVVVEGRDIGTVVFPDAELKVYLTAPAEVRARRRATEVGGVDERTLAEWTDNIASRDHLDSTRADSPLRPAPDAVEIDTGPLGIDEVVETIAERLGA